MDKASLRHTINETPNAPREIVVQYLKLLSNEAKGLSASEREARGDYHDQNHKFPQTKGEDIASDISSCLAQQDWIDWDSEPELEEIGSVAGSLEINTDDHKLWQKLSDLVDKLT